MDLTVAIATFGDPVWADLARARAGASAFRLDLPVVYRHRGSLAEARNAALAEVRTEHVVHLDADDELESGFEEAMETATADVRVPSVRYVHADRAEDPRMPRVAGHTHDCVAACLTEGNWCVVGSAVRADLVREVGGWLDEPFYEDWSLWLRCHMAGATFDPVPQAIYRAHVRPGSRNVAHTAAVRRRVFEQIRRRAGVTQSSGRST